MVRLRAGKFFIIAMPTFHINFALIMIQSSHMKSYYRVRVVKYLLLHSQFLRSSCYYSRP